MPQSLVADSPPGGIHHIGEFAGDDSSNSFGGASISRHLPHSRRAHDVGHRTFLSQLLDVVLQAAIVGNLALTNFFAIATQSSQPHRILYRCDNSLIGPPTWARARTMRARPGFS